MPKINETMAIMRNLTEKTFQKADFVNRVKELHPRIAELIEKSVDNDATFEMTGELVANYNRTILQIKHAGKLIGSGMATVWLGDKLDKPRYESTLKLPTGIELSGYSLKDEKKFKLTQTVGNNPGFVEYYELPSGERDNNAIMTDFNIVDQKAERHDGEDIICYYNKDGEEVKSIKFENDYFNTVVFQESLKGGRQARCEISLRKNGLFGNGIIIADSQGNSVLLCPAPKDYMYLHVTSPSLITLDKDFNVLDVAHDFPEDKNLLEAKKKRTKIPDSFIQKYGVTELFEMYKNIPNMIDEAKKLSQNNKKFL